MPLPLLEHPVSLAFVDDSQSFLESVAFMLTGHAQVVLFDSATHAAERLLRSGTANPATLSPHEGGLLTDLRTIHHRALDPERFSETAVAFVDYSMPEQDGLSLCSLLRETPLQLVLFTGQADQKVAVEAFNNRLIDYFLPKHNDALAQLPDLIARFTRRYFEQQSDFLRRAIKLNPESILHDDSLDAFVTGLKRQHGFIEHYYLAEPEGLLLLKPDGKKWRLVIESEAGMHAQIETAIAYGAPVSLIEALRSGAVVPYFWRSGGMYNIECLEWKKYVHSARLHHGRTTYHWALIESPPDLNNLAVTSFNARASGVH
jgi:CheY-like chemotaxis protein